MSPSQGIQEIKNPRLRLGLGLGLGKRFGLWLDVLSSSDHFLVPAGAGRQVHVLVAVKELLRCQLSEVGLRRVQGPGSGPGFRLHAINRW